MKIIRQYMHNQALLILGLCLCAINSYKLLKGADIPKNYEIGTINYVEYVGDDKIYFKSVEDVMGLINATSGALTTVFELEDDQNILEHRGSQFIIIEKNRDINLLNAKQQAYFKLKYSEYLEKQKFEKIIVLKRFSQHDYILTDQFLAMAQHVLIMRGASGNYTEEEKFKIIYRKQNPNDVIFKLITVLDKRPSLGIVLFNQKDNKKQLCIIKIVMLSSNKPQRICTSIDPKLKIFDVAEAGPGIHVRTQKSNFLYNYKLQFIQEIQFQNITTYFAELNKAFQKNKNNPKAQNNHIKYITPPDQLIINVYQRYILVRKEDSILANIEKNPKDIPIYNWSYRRNRESSKIDLIIQYADGRVLCYEVDEKEKKIRQLWSFLLNIADKSIAGEERQAKESNLQAQQDLEQIEKEEDIQINAKDKNENNQL